MNKLVRFYVFVYTKLKGRPEFFTAVDQLLTDKFLCRDIYLLHTYRFFFNVNLSSVSLSLPAVIPGVVAFRDSLQGAELL